MATRRKAEQVAIKLKEMKLADAAELVRQGGLYYYVFPCEHWRCLRTNNPLDRILVRYDDESGQWEPSRMGSPR